jgi:hypothetical protein
LRWFNCACILAFTRNPFLHVVIEKRLTDQTPRKDQGISRFFTFFPTSTVPGTLVQGLVRLTSPAARARPLWSIPVLVSELCHRLNVQQDDVLPEVEGDGPYESTLPNLPDCSYAPAWIRIEAGIARLSALARDKPAGRRPKSDRDQLWLKSFEDETSGTTFNSLAGIRAKCNADHPQEQVTREVVKKGIKKAREERQTSQ